MVLKLINQAIERAIGADHINKEQRRELMAHQLNSLQAMTPGVLFGSSLMMLALLISSNSGAAFYQMAIWGVVVVFAQLIILNAWRRNRNLLKKKRLSLRSIGFSCAGSAAYGLVWGAVPIIALPIATNNLETTVFIAITSMIFTISFARAAFPQMVVAFIIPVIGGMALGVSRKVTGIEEATVSLLLVSFMMVVPILTLRHARILTQHVITEIAMREQKNIIGLLLNEFEENSSDWLWEFNGNGEIQRPSGRFVNVCAQTSKELDGKHFVNFLQDHTTDNQTTSQLSNLIADRKSFRDIEVLITIDNKNHIWLLTGKPNFDKTGVYRGFVGIGRDVTFAKNAELKINKLAHSDVLTGLMNRASFNQEMDAATAKLERFGTAYGLLFLDLDKFKLVNDTRGHATGDKLLVQVSDRIREIIRSSDVIARLGGDEFAIIMHQDCDAGAAAKLAAKLIAHVGAPYDIDDEVLSIGVSIGIALAPQNGTRPTQVLRNADLALYRSKDDGRGVFRFFESQMDADQREKRMLELELRHAIDNNEFELFYQPLISSTTGEPITSEALIRWHHPIRGLISPGEFIPLAEQSTIIMEIGNWSINEACLAAAEWPNDIAVAVNISGPHFVGTDIVAHTKHALEKSNLAPHRLEIEVTESLLIDNTEEVLRTLKALKELGVKIALDDFGTGYSSLAYILKFPFDKIKIDQAFIAAAVDDPSARSILNMISALGQSLNITITAEGVETLEQIEILKDINCQQYQGYFFAKPMPKADLAIYYLQHFKSQVTSDNFPIQKQK